MWCFISCFSTNTRSPIFSLLIILRKIIKHTNGLTSYQMTVHISMCFKYDVCMRVCGCCTPTPSTHVFTVSPRCALYHRLDFTMSWLLAVWIGLGFLLFCQATLYQTLQQHHVARPGRTDILTLGTCTSLSIVCSRGRMWDSLSLRQSSQLSPFKQKQTAVLSEWLAVVLFCYTMIHRARSHIE